MCKVETAILASDAFCFSIEALAVSKAIHDLVLTDDQKAKLPKLIKKHRERISDEFSVSNAVPQDWIEGFLKKRFSTLEDTTE